jgi:hypothetical protein
LATTHAKQKIPLEKLEHTFLSQVNEYDLNSIRVFSLIVIGYSDIVMRSMNERKR